MMVSKRKKLSNPFSTGGGGVHFEAHIQASFVTLMLTGGYAPCLPCWPISEIKLQGKINGFDTDDLIVVIESPDNKERRKLLGQIKHSIMITQGNMLFGEVMQAAWNDFNNPKLFKKNSDIIALITGPLNATDAYNVQWLLNHARHTKDVDEFFRHVYQAYFSPSKSKVKLEVIQHHLKKANGNIELSREELYSFLNDFHLISYDLGSEFGVVLSLLHSHISQFQPQFPQWVWPKIVETVQTWNQDAGTIVLEKLPEDLRNAFKQKVMLEMPEELKSAQEQTKTDWTNYPNATYLAIAVLIGAWNERNANDIEVITQLFGIDYETWLQKAREILHLPDSPLSFKNGIWSVVTRDQIWGLLGSRILDRDLEVFKRIAITVLKISDPSFKLPADERFMASIQGKVLDYSQVLRKGIAEGLAILGSQPDICCKCSQVKIEETTILAIREIFAAADWTIWGSLNNLLPILAEAAPAEFLHIVENTLLLSPCPFDQLFAQEGKGITGANYLTGLLWALECLAWDEQYFVRSCTILGDLASHDPGGQWSNRPANSLITILLPWLPQTLASIEKRKVAVKTLLKEWPEVAWTLIINLLPGQHQSSSGSHKPSWRKIIPNDGIKNVTNQEYWQQTSFYAELAVDAARYNLKRLTELIDYLDRLPETAFNQLMDILSSKDISELSEDKRLLLWEHLTKFITKQKRYAGMKGEWQEARLSDLDNVTKLLEPKDPFYLFHHLFSNRDFDLYDENGDWEIQKNKLNERRDAAIKEIFQKNDIKTIIQFAESVDSPVLVGYALGSLRDKTIEKSLIPHFFDVEDSYLKDLVRGFIWKKHQMEGESWCDSINISLWTNEQIGIFLSLLPFTIETWNRVSLWLKEYQEEYWSRTDANVYQADGELRIPIEKLTQYGRPHSAIDCLYKMLHDKMPIDVNQCVNVLLLATSSNELARSRDGYHIIELIKYLQSDPSVNKDDLFKIEWAYLPLLDVNMGIEPKVLESRLASDPDFFCEVIRLVYRSKNESEAKKEPSEELKNIAMNALRLLHNWRTPPGMQENGEFIAEQFSSWLRTVKDLCNKSGHLEIALSNVGEVLIYAPADSNGLWIDRTVASALNDVEAKDIRKGFKLRTYKSRGVHSIDPSGKPEQKLAKQFSLKANSVENAGFQRFAVTLRELANEYEREAERIITQYNGG
jgi:hypothetical protein